RCRGRAARAGSGSAGGGRGRRSSSGCARSTAPARGRGRRRTHARGPGSPGSRHDEGPRRFRSRSSPPSGGGVAYLCGDSRAAGLDGQNGGSVSQRRTMLERAERRRRAVAYGIVFVVALTQRAAVFLVHRARLDAYIDANASWYTFQHLPREMLGDHLFRSLVLLQQTPPASNLLMGLALKWFSWPTGVAHAMIGMEAAVSILTALVLVHLIATLYPRRVALWVAVGLLFVLNNDLIVIEYASMGQLIYGPLAMLFSLLVVD